MPITPWYKGDLVPLWTIQLVPDSGVFNVSGLAPSSFALFIKNTDTGVETNGGGTFSSITAATTTTPASVQYAPSTADVGTLGNFTLFVVVTFPAGHETFSLGSWQVVSS